MTSNFVKNEKRKKTHKFLDLRNYGEKRNLYLLGFLTISKYLKPLSNLKKLSKYGGSQTQILVGAGPDELKPIVLKHLGEKAVNKLVEFFKASSLLGYVPLQWRDSKAVLIPKPGKSDYSQVRSLQPISLSSFLMKALERVWAWRHEESTLIQNPLSCDQHAFRRGYCTDSALSTMVECAESAIIQNKFALDVFLDISGL